MLSEKVVYLKITGRVQGVGYRVWTRRIAAKIGGISGWVRNAEDGSVEVFAKGVEDKIDSLILSCREGPFLARVDNIKFQPPVIKGFLPDVKDGVFEVI